ncbi:MAG: hypothetical protein LBP62_05910 [Clostridiales bacterium]|jgi:hypothetical protein|nr:hypothetical protein [Clostridiales bacterium]
MAEVFEDGIKKALKFAQKLADCGENEASLSLCVKCVKKAADMNGTDLISKVYGEAAYSKITRTTDAIMYIFIAKCAARAFEALQLKGGNLADLTKTNGAKARAANDFSSWLNESGKRVDYKDAERFKKFCDALSH